MSAHILITGASIAGNTAAWLLAQQGLKVTVVEKAPQFRNGGQNIDVRGVGREVLKQMKLEEAALLQGTGEEGTQWIDEYGQPVAEFKTSELEGDGPTAELEILHGDLAKLLYDATRSNADYYFGDYVKSINDDGETALVTFASGRTDQFDAVIVAEGVGSSTRELVFPNENDVRWMDLTLAYFTIPRTADDNRMWRWYHTTNGRSVSLRPDQHGTTRAMLSIQRQAQGEQDWDTNTQKRFMQEQFADAGWQASRVLEGMKTSEDFYFDALRQVQMPRWHRDRIVLTGDSAWCATPLAGIGTTLALTGAYVLAGEIALAKKDKRALSSAFEAYEKAMRPMVDEGQGVPKIGPRLMNPHSRLGIHLLHGALQVASLPGIRDAFAKLFSRPVEGPDLSRYQ